MQSFIKDLQFGLRTLRKQPVFCIIAVVTMALGIGINTGMFSIVNATLLKPLPYSAADRLVFVRDIQPQLRDLPGSYHEFLDWQDQTQLFDAAGAYWSPALTLTGDAGPERLRATRVTPSMFDLLDLRPTLGRVLAAADDDPNAEPVAVISHSLWERRFGSSPDVLGRRLELDGVMTTVVGVLPDGLDERLPTDLRFGRTRDIWVPLRLTLETTNRGSHFLTVVARLAPGVGLAQADAEIERVAQSFKDDGRTRHGIMLVSVHERIVGGSRTSVLILMGAVGFVLLIACVNVANLLLARAASRHKEVAIRSSLGAGRWRLVRQFLTETTLLAGTGGALGLVLAWWAVRLFTASPAAGLLRAGEVLLDPFVMLFCAGITIATGLLAGVAPALQATSTNLQETLKADGRRTGGGEGKRAFRNALVIAEVGLSLILLVGAGLLLRSFQNLLDVDLGFDQSNLLTFRVSLPDSKYDEDVERRIRFFDDAIEQINAIPGVEGTGIVTTLPIEGGWNSPFNVEGIEWPDGFSPLAENRRVNPDYFGVMRIPVVRGRGLAATDGPESQGVIVVNEEFVKQVFGDEDPLGRRVYWGSNSDNPRVEIVGVVADVQHWGIGRERRPAIYRPYVQSPQQQSMFVIRTAADPLQLTQAVRERILLVDPDQPIANIRAMDAVVEGNLARRRLSMRFLLGFAILALALAAIGLYGVMNYMVSQRTHEMGLRMAMGAQPASIVGLILRHGLVMTSAGLALGTVGALLLTRFMSSLVFGVSTMDVVTFVAVPVVLQAVALLACFLPARRASRVDPMVALRT